MSCFIFVRTRKYVYTLFDLHYNFYHSSAVFIKISDSVLPLRLSILQTVLQPHSDSPSTNLFWLRQFHRNIYAASSQEGVAEPSLLPLRGACMVRNTISINKKFPTVSFPLQPVGSPTGMKSMLERCVGLPPAYRKGVLPFSLPCV